MRYYILLYPFLWLGLFSCGQGFEAHNNSVGKSQTPSAGKVKLTWQAPTLDQAGNALVDLGGYTLFYATAPVAVARDVTQINVGIKTSYEIANLPSGKYYFVVSAYDLSGNQSPHSEEAWKRIP